MKTVKTVEQIRSATGKVKALRQTMAFVVPLTEAERREHKSARIGEKKLRVVGNRLVAAQQHRDLLPPAFDLRKFEQDTASAQGLSECLAAIEEMGEAVRDTLLAVGNRAAVAAATAYAHIQVASTTAKQLKRTVEKLASRRAPTTEPTVPVIEPVVVAGGKEPSPTDSPPAAIDKAA